MKLAPLFFAGICSLGLVSAARAQTYVVTVIGSGYATAINNSGFVVGVSGAINSQGSAISSFSYQNGVLTSLAPLQRALAVNDDGLIVGDSYLNSQREVSTTDNRYLEAFSQHNGVTLDLGNLTSGGMPSQSYAAGVNNSGLIVGTDFPGDTARAFSYLDGVMSDLGTLGGDYSSASAVNSSGQIVGLSTTSSGTERAFTFSGGVMTDLGIDASPTAINDAGMIVGHDASTNHAFSYFDGVETDLGSFGGVADSSTAVDVNGLGMIVGGSHATGSAYKNNAFVYYAGVMTDLNLVTDLTGTDLVELASANSINDSGQIVGVGLNAAGAREAFLLTPVHSAVPDAGPTVGLLGGALAALAVLHRRSLKGKASHCG